SLLETRVYRHFKTLSPSMSLKRHHSAQMEILLWEKLFTVDWICFARVNRRTRRTASPTIVPGCSSLLMVSRQMNYGSKQHERYRENVKTMVWCFLLWV